MTKAVLRCGYGVGETNGIPAMRCCNASTTRNEHGVNGIPVATVS